MEEKFCFLYANLLKIFYYRWLVTKQRDQEALLVLSKINWQSQENTFIDTYIELEELKESASIDSKKSKYRVLLREMSKWKYISRYEFDS